MLGYLIESLMIALLLVVIAMFIKDLISGIFKKDLF